MKDGWAKWCLRKAAGGLAPDDIIWRRDKMGFGTPEPDLVKYLALARSPGSALEGVAADYMDPEAVRGAMQAAVGSRVNKETVSRAFRCMVFNSWAAQFPVS